MSARQEVANALTTLAPALYFWWALSQRHYDATLPMWLLVTSVWFHAPFSFAYHSLCAARHEDPHFDTLGSVWRRLDHTTIHLSAACIAFATSNSALYFLACAAFNAVAALLHWTTSSVNLPRNQCFTCLAVLLYVLPLHPAVFRGSPPRDCFFPALATFFLAGLTFRTYAFGGYSHAIFHLLMTLFSHFIFLGACATADFSRDDPSGVGQSSLRLLWRRHDR